jgi:hypothetical protein
MSRYIRGFACTNGENLAQNKTPFLLNGLYRRNRLRHFMRNAELNHAELHSPRFADHVLIPGRIPNELDIGFIDTVDG